MTMDGFVPWFTMFESEWIVVPADPCCPRGLGSWRGSVAPACRRSEGAKALLMGKISDITHGLVLGSYHCQTKYATDLQVTSLLAEHCVVVVTFKLMGTQACSALRNILSIQYCITSINNRICNMENFNRIARST